MADKKEAGLPKAIILERGQDKSKRVDGATYVDRETFDKVARATGAGTVGELPSDASLALGSLTGKAREEVEKILTGK